jgi:hypothetical protein
MSAADREILRDLARRYVEICSDPVHDERRKLWQAHNSMKGDRVPVHVRAFAWQEMPQSRCECEDPFLRRHERHLRHQLFRSTFGDDTVLEPWVTVDAARVLPEGGIWGLPVQWIEGDEPRGAKRIDPPIKDPEDAKKMVAARHVIDEEETARRLSRLGDAIGDIVSVGVDRAPVYMMWHADISTMLGYLRGIEEIMYDMTDRPEWLHGVLAFMRDGILAAQQEAEDAGDWGLCDHRNQTMPYCEELPGPSLELGAARSELWCFCASQELTLVSPDMFYEFMVQYQIPIIEKFGLVAYGCCEDLTDKIDVMRRIPNLRRIGVSPMADAARCAEQIGTDYILSYRPSPTDMVGYGFDEDRIRRILTRDLEACRGCRTDIILKDVETVEGDPDRVRRWVEVARDVVESL